MVLNYNLVGCPWTNTVQAVQASTENPSLSLHSRSQSFDPFGQRRYGMRRSLRRTFFRPESSRGADVHDVHTGHTHFKLSHIWFFHYLESAKLTFIWSRRLFIVFFNCRGKWICIIALKCRKKRSLKVRASHFVNGQNLMLFADTAHISWWNTWATCNLALEQFMSNKMFIACS